MIYTKIQIYLFFLIITCFSCKQSTKTTAPDVSHIDMEVVIERFDLELVDIDTVNPLVWSNAMSTKYGAFYDMFLLLVLGVDRHDEAAVAGLLPKIVSNKAFQDLAVEVKDKYPDMHGVEKELGEAFRYFKYYVPEVVKPRLISFFSGFEVQVPIGDNYVGIGLDMFLGADSKFYPAIIEDVPRYISRRFTPANIVPRVMESVLRMDYFPQSNNDASTLEHMVYHGKIMYALDLILPYAADSVKIGYTSDQMQWAQKYEQDIWGWFLAEDILFSTDYMRTQHYFSEAPFTRELGENNESAPKLGIYIGWKMIRQYMQRHPEVSLSQLFDQQDAQAILQASKYKGK